MLRAASTRVVALFALLVLCSCATDEGPTGPGLGPADDTVTFEAPWPENLESALTTVFNDGAGDQEALPPEMAGPPYSGPVPFPPVDVIDVAVGVVGDFMYMRVDYAGTIPSDIIHVAQEGEIEEQWVRNQGMNIAMNTDGNMQTGGGGEGVDGIDIFFAVKFDYGSKKSIYANWDFPDGDLHHHQSQALGEVGAGGPGHDFVIVRYDVSALGAFFPRGGTVDVGSWSEAESFNEDGSLKYHHFAFDRVIDGEQWTIPQ